MGFVQPRHVSTIVPTSKQKTLVSESQREKELSIRNRIAQSTTRRNPQINGGGPIEEGGDGTGFAGGVDLHYWEERLKHFSVLRGLIGQEPVEGLDYPSPLQMEKARTFAKARQKEQ